MMINRIYLQVVVIALILLILPTKAQISGAKIIYERKTNLYKKFRHWNEVKEWIKEEDKIKTDFFELYISDTFSLFKPQESELRDRFGWATSSNVVYQDFNHNHRYMIKTIWGEELHLTDSLVKRQWRITESTRKIAGYTCRKAVWQANDTTRIYAWFSYDLTPSTGPESFNGLPGTILGLATEDGGVVYFAKKVDILTPETSLFTRPKKKKIHTVEGLKKQLTDQYGKEKWFKRMMNEQFNLW